MKHIRAWLDILSIASNVFQSGNIDKKVRLICDAATAMLISEGYPVIKMQDGSIMIEDGDIKYHTAPKKPVQGEETPVIPNDDASRLSAENKKLNDTIRTLRGAIAEKEAENQRLKSAIAALTGVSRPEMPKSSAIIPPTTAYENEEITSADANETKAAPAKQEVNIKEQEPASAGSQSPTHSVAVVNHTEKPEPQAPVQAANPVQTQPTVPAQEPEPAVEPDEEPPYEPIPFAEAYLDHMTKQDISLSYHQLILRNPDSSHAAHAEVLISPVTMDEGEVNIIAWMNDGDKTETRMSRGTRKSVLLKAGEIDLIAEGRVTHGKFSGKLSLTKKMEVAGIILEEVTNNVQGRLGHIRLEDENIELRVVPLATRNKASGNAEIAYAIIQGDEPPVTGDNMEDDEVTFLYQGTKVKLMARWKDDTLYAAVAADE